METRLTTRGNFFYLGIVYTISNNPLIAKICYRYVPLQGPTSMAHNERLLSAKKRLDAKLTPKSMDVSKREPGTENNQSAVWYGILLAVLLSMGFWIALALAVI